MAKRRQTTGLPRAERQAQPGAAGTKGADLRTHAEREADVQRMILLGVGLALGLVILMLVVAFINDQFITPSRTVASVNDEDISISDFRDRTRLERLVNIESINGAINSLLELGFSFDEAGNQVIQFEPYASQWNELNASEQMGLRVINDMIGDQLVLAEVEARNITVSQDEIEEQIRQVLGFDPDLFDPLPDPEATPEVEPTSTPTPLVSPTPSPTPTDAPTEVPADVDEAADEAADEAGDAEAGEVPPTFTPIPTIAPVPTRTAEERDDAFRRYLDNFYDRARQDAGASRDDVNRFFELRALRVALGREVADVGTTGTWVNARHILVETEEIALDILDALANGESFAELARAVSADTGSGERGGELDWQSVDNYVEPFADAVRDAPLGEIVGPVESEFGFHIIQVRAREQRDLTEAQIEQNQQEAMSEWLREQRELETNEIEINDIWPDYVPTNPPFVFRER